MWKNNFGNLSKKQIQGAWNRMRSKIKNRFICCFTVRLVFLSSLIFTEFAQMLKM
jgi:hypothetical protein